MKTATAILAAIASATLLAACSSTPQPVGTLSAGPQTSGSATAKRSVVFIQEVTGNDFSSSESCGAQAAAQELGWQYDTTGPAAFDATQQITYVNSVAAKSPDGVLIGPDDGVALRAPMKQMADAGITLVELDTSLEDDSISISQISSDNTAGGALAAETLSGLLGGKGKILIIGLRPGVTTGDQRIAGFTSWMKKNAPGIEIVSTRYDNNDTAKSAAIVSAQLSATPDLSAVFGIDLNNVVGAVTGVRQAGVAGKVKVVGFDAGPQQVKLLESGELDFVVSQSPYQMGYQGVQQLKNSFEGTAVEKKIATPLQVVTKENLKDAKTAQFLYVPTCS